MVISRMNKLINRVGVLLNNARVEIGSFLSTITFCFSLSWNASKYYSLIRFAGRIITSLCGIVSSFTVKHILDLLSGAWTPDKGIQIVLPLLLGLLLALTLLTKGVQRAIQYSQTIHNDLISKQIELGVMEQALKADIEFFDNPAYYDKLTAASRDSYAVVNIVWNVLECLSALITCIGAFGVLLGSNQIYGLCILVAAVPSALAGARYTKLLYRLSIEQLNGVRQKNYLYQLSTTRQYAQDIRFFHMGAYLKNRYISIWDQLFHERRTLLRKRSVLTGLLGLLPELVTIGITVDICYGVLSGRATMGDYSLYTGLSAQLTQSVFLLSSTAMQIYDDRLRVSTIKQLGSFNNSVVNSGIKKLSRVGTIEFCNVSFSYPGTEHKVLKNINFVIGDGEKVALVGLNGSGKSTLIKLLLRFYNVDSGEIRINGQNIQNYELVSLRSAFSVYFQDMKNYSFSLRENMRISDLEQIIDDDAILNALQSSDAGELMESLPNGLDTYLSRAFHNEGVELSGGQNQKLALSRAFYRRHSALILDEPSSNLDPEAESRVFEALNQLCSGKTTLFTSHRLSNVVLADRIVVIENGMIIEQGTQERLLQKGGRYAELFRYQQEKYSATQKNCNE